MAWLPRGQSTWVEKEMMYVPLDSPRYNSSVWYTAVHDPLQFTAQFGSQIEISDLGF